MPQLLDQVPTKRSALWLMSYAVHNNVYYDTDLLDLYKGLKP